MGRQKLSPEKKYHVLTAVTSSESVIVPMNMKISKNLFTFASSLSVTTKICMNPKGSCSHGSDIALFGNNVGYEAGRSYKK